MVAASLLLMALAAAQAAAPPPAPPRDPNERICVAQADTASRITPRRMCLTRSEWEQYRREMRSSVDRVQAQSQSRCPGTMGTGC